MLTFLVVALAIARPDSAVVWQHGRRTDTAEDLATSDHTLSVKLSYWWNVR